MTKNDARPAEKPPRRVPWLLAGLALGWCVGLATGGRTNAPAPSPAPPGPAPVATPSASVAPARLATTRRMEGLSLVRPLLECDLPVVGDPVDLRALSTALGRHIDGVIGQGRVSHVSVYARDFESTAELRIRSDELFTPASLLKVPAMMMVLRAAEHDTAILDRPVVFDVQAEDVQAQVFRPTHDLKLGETYPLGRIMEQMIIESDNRALRIFGRMFPEKEYRQTYTDMGLTAAHLAPPRAMMSVEEYATFFRILYNAAYLGPEMSERALDLLSRAAFKDGLVAGVPADVRVAHKFGERTGAVPGDPEENQLHDCGIVYLPHRPYLICVMTRGRDTSGLVSVIRDVSREVYAHFAARVE